MPRDWEHRSWGESPLAVLEQPREIESQINVAPTTDKGLWKVIFTALRCPACGSTAHKAETGRRVKSDGMTEQYRRCGGCAIRFRTVFE